MLCSFLVLGFYIIFSECFAVVDCTNKIRVSFHCEGYNERGGRYMRYPQQLSKENCGCMCKRKLPKTLQILMLGVKSLQTKRPAQLHT